MFESMSKKKVGTPSLLDLDIKEIDVFCVISDIDS